jgi:hypothetical protein
MRVVLEKLPKYEKLAPRFKELHDKGASIATIASMHKVVWQYANDVLHFAETGERPKSSRKRKRRHRGQMGKTRIPKYIQFASLVARLRDEEHKMFPAIAAHIWQHCGVHIARGTLSRAYDHAHPEVVAEATERFTTPERGRGCRIGEEKRREIRRLLRDGLAVSTIAAKVGCSNGPVYHERTKLKAERPFLDRDRSRNSVAKQKSQKGSSEQRK